MLSPLRPLLASLLCLCLVACASTPKKDGLPPGQAYSAAALGWEGAALRLPKGSPLVLTVRPDLVVGALKNLFEWTIADPGLFGMPGVSGAVVRFLLERRDMLKDDFGFDLLEMEAWPQWLETGRSVHIALYPLSAQGQDFVATYESELRQALDAPPQQPLLDALSSPSSPPPPGLHAGLWRAVGEVDPGLGMRVVGETGEPGGLRRWFEREALALLSSPYDPVAKEAGLTKVLMMEAETSSLVVALDLSAPGLFVLDVILTDPVQQLTDVQKRDHVQATLASRPPQGRPIAPRASRQTEHAVSLSADRQGVHDWLNMMGYEAALEGAATLGALERDAQLLQNTAQVLGTHGGWHQVPDFAPQVAYELDFPTRGETVVRLGMVLFPGPDPLPLPPRASSSRSLGIPGRSLGASLYPAMTWSPQWQAWAGPGLLEPCKHAAEAFDFTRGVAELVVWASGLPMCGAAALSNVQKTTALIGLPADALPGGKFIRQVRHVESTLPDGDLSNFQLNPRALVLIDLEPQTALMDRKAFGHFVHTVAKGLLEEEAARVPGIQTGAKALTPKEILPLEASGPLAKVIYYWDQEAQVPWLLLGYGVGEEGFGQEVRRIEAARGDTEDAALFVKLNPMILLEMTSTFGRRLGSWINWSNLSRRLGSLEFRVQPEHVDSSDPGTKHIRYDLTLGAPTTP